MQCLNPESTVKYLGDIKGDEFTIAKTDECPRNRRQDGYGDKIPCPYMVRFGKRNYRVYAICWSNAASHYVLIGGERYFLHDYDFDLKAI
jgi:hypothetical protein